MARGATVAARWLHESQQISNQPVGLGFSHRAGRYRPGGSPFSSPGCWSRRDMVWKPQPHWVIADPQPISNHPVGLGFPHLAGRYRPGRSLFLSPGCWSCRDMEDFLTRGWELTLSGFGGTSALARGATLAARWLHESQPISNHPVGLGFLHRVGRYRPGRSLFESAGLLE